MKCKSRTGSDPSPPRRVTWCREWFPGFIVGFVLVVRASLPRCPYLEDHALSPLAVLSPDLPLLLRRNLVGPAMLLLI